MVSYTENGESIRVAYLVNQYPMPSHAWIRREINAVEKKGVKVFRYSCRGTKSHLIDNDDLVEAKSTEVILDGNTLGLVRKTLRRAIYNPKRFYQSVKTCFLLGWRSTRGIPAHFAYLVEACVLLDSLEKHKVHHIHAHFSTNPAAIACLCRTLGGPSYSFTFHGPDLLEFPNLNGLGIKIQGADFVCCISEHGRSQLYRWSSPENWNKFNIVRCGVDDPYIRYAPSPLPMHRNLICIARLAPAKGHLVLLKALGKLQHKNLAPHLTLVGDGEFKKPIEDEIRKQNLTDRVSMTGWSDSKQIRNMLEDAAIMVLPSFDEGLPVVIMESLALKRPIISTYIAGIPELVIPGENGWLIPAGSVESLADALEQALTMPYDDLVRYGENGRKRVLRNHNIDTETDKLTRLFTQVTDYRREKTRNR